MLKIYVKILAMMKLLERIKQKQYSLLSTCIFIICILYSLVMLIGRFNFLAVVAVGLAIGLALLILTVLILKRKIDILLISSYLTVMISVLLFYILWGADSFAKRFFSNLLWTGIPIFLAFLILFLDKKQKIDFTKLVSSLLVVSVLGATILYFLIMSIRVKPSVYSMQKGHDEYLNYLRNNNSIDESSPNVLIILMDDMAYSDLSCYSYLGREDASIKTTNIDALADDGIMMDNFYACSPVCSPSRFGILTGRYSSRGYLDNVIFPTALSLQPFGITRYVNPFQFPNNVDGILGDEITFAEIMRSVGYSTALFGKWNLGDYGEYLPTNQGFDYFFGSYYVNDMTPYNMVREQNGIAEQVFSHKDLLDQSETTKNLTQEILSYVDNAVDNNQKFLAYYATPWPHYPIFSGKKYDTSDDSYIHCIEEFDDYLGDIIDLLKDKGVYDDTLIIFTSDNGPGREGVAGALRGRKNTTFDGGQKVPFIVTYSNGGVGKGAAFEQSNVISTQAMNIDIFPTILKYIGVEQLPSDRAIDGVSLNSLLNGECDANIQIHNKLVHIKSGKIESLQMPIELDGKTYIFKYYDRVMTENSAFLGQYYNNYLFNLTLDPAEGYNVSMVYPEIAKQLNNELERTRKDFNSNRRGINWDYYN